VANKEAPAVKLYRMIWLLADSARNMSPAGLNVSPNRSIDTVADGVPLDGCCSGPRPVPFCRKINTLLE
jgi:hypothetical protein